MRPTVRHFALALVAGSVAVKLWSVFFGVADLALFSNQFAYDGVVNPEGALWAYLNQPIINLRSNFDYRLWCFTFDMSFLALFLWTPRFRVPSVMLAFEQIVSTYAYVGWGHTYQNVTIIALCPLIFLTRYAAVLPLVMKLPVWFDFRNLVDHVGCALYCTPVHGLGNISTYAVLGFCFLCPWIMSERRGFWLSTDRWKLW